MSINKARKVKPFKFKCPTAEDLRNILRDSITKEIIEKDCRQTKCQVNLNFKNGYRKIVAMVKDRTNSRNYTFDGYMDLHLKKAGTIFNICYPTEYNECHKETMMSDSLQRVDRFINPEDDDDECFTDYVKTPKQIKRIDPKNTDSENNNKTSRIITLTSSSEETGISINEAEHISFSDLRDEALSSLRMLEDEMSKSEPPINEVTTSEINSEEVQNQKYENFNLMLLAQVQSTQNSQLQEDLFAFSQNAHEKANDVNWDDVEEDV